MQLNLHLSLPRSMTLIPGYGHQLQSAIYYALGQQGFGIEAHDYGVPYADGTFKLFTFGRLHGPHRFDGFQLTFFHSLNWEVRSCRRDWMEALADWYRRIGEIKLFDTMLPVDTVCLSDNRITVPCVRIKTETPIFLRKRGQSETGFLFPSPGSFEGQAMIGRCFERRYTAFFGSAPCSEIRLTPLSQPEELMVHYKNAIFPSWNGSFQLEGDPEYLSFLYDSGLGSKTSCGLGMFYLI